MTTESSKNAARDTMREHFERTYAYLISGYYKPKNEKEWRRWFNDFIQDNHNLFKNMTNKLARKIDNVS